MRHLVRFWNPGCAILLAVLSIGAGGVGAQQPIAERNTIFKEIDGLVVVEAEHFFKQTRTEKRAWYLTTPGNHPSLGEDADPPHVEGASGGAYLEILPDTRHHHGHRLIPGENFSNRPGRLGVLHYRVNITNPGRYYVWVRAYSTGSEDNGLHVGINGEWPESGQRLQWCEGRNSWRWESKQRTAEAHCGEPGKIFLDIDQRGDYEILFSMREDGFEFDQWLMTTNRNLARPESFGPASVVKLGTAPPPFVIPADYRDPSSVIEVAAAAAAGASRAPLVQPRRPDGDGKVELAGELKQWHKVTLTQNGPYAHELDNDPNPFTDWRMTVRFIHESGSPSYRVPGYFAADGDAANSSAQAGTKWRAHLSPDKPGTWRYRISFVQGKQAALDAGTFRAVAPFHGVEGSFLVEGSDKQAPDFRALGRLQYVNRHYLRHTGSGEYFLKAGADAPETLLAYEDFDDMVAPKPNAPLKTWQPHVRDWREGDPTWQGEKGKGLIGALNYLSGKGCNAFSFLTYNAGGDGDNVWPFVSRDDKLHYDCSKLDQWQAVFDHATARGLYLHFKMQETEMDDDRGHKSGDKPVPTALDGGDLGVERKLYCRELVARFAHELALNWNLGEENTQSTGQQKAMAQYIRDLDPYHHHIVVHTFPNRQDKVYRPLLGDRSVLSGASLQNSDIKDTHEQTLKWVKASAEAGKPWVVAFDESGSAAHGQCPDLGYQGYDGRDRDGKMTYTQHEVRKQTLWGTLMAGGAGVEYYFGYKYVENDLNCEDWRSRDKSWDYCRIALDFFRENAIPFWEMKNANALAGNPENDNRRYCFAQAGEVYLVYLPNGGTAKLDLSAAQGRFTVRWFDPRSGGPLRPGTVKSVPGGGTVALGKAPDRPDEDWLVVVRR